MIVDLLSHGGSQTSDGFDGILRDTGALPDTIGAGDHVTIDLTNLSLAQRTPTAGQEDGFLVGSDVGDANGDDRFRVANAGENADPATELIRRDFEFGDARAALSVGPNDIRADSNDACFYIQAVPVPEPVSLALPGLGGLRLIGRRQAGAPTRSTTHLRLDLTRDLT